MSWSIEDVVEYCNQFLQALYTRPQMYGSLETVEFQAVLLLDLRWFVQHPERSQQDRKDHVLSAWKRYLDRNFHIGSRYLCSWLADHESNEDSRYCILVEELAEFDESLSRSGDGSPDAA